jgi:Na+/melibiose symporter-like transporter
MVSSYVSTLRGSSRNVRLYLVAAALIGLTTYGGIYATLFNLFLLRLGYGPEFIGLVNAAGSVSWSAFCLVAGWLGGRLGPRRVMVIGLTFLTLGNALLPLAGLVPGSWEQGWLVWINALGAGGMAMYVVAANPFLMAITAVEERSHVYAVASAIGPLAACVGSLLAGVLPGLYAAATGASLTTPAPYRFPLFLAAVLLVPGVLAILRTEVPEPVRAQNPGVAHGVIPWGLIGVLTLALSLQVCAEAATRTFFNVYLDVALSVPTAQIGLLMAVGQMLAVPFALTTPLFVARVGNARTFAWTSLALATVLVPLALVPRLGVAAGAFIAIVALAAMARPAVQVYQMQVVRPAWRDAMAGATAAGSGLMWVLVGLGGGYLITTQGFSSMFLASAVLTGAGTLLFLVHLWSRGPQGDRAPDG